MAETQTPARVRLGSLQAPRSPWHGPPARFKRRGRRTRLVAIAGVCYIVMAKVGSPRDVDEVALPKILIVENDAIVALALAEILRQLRCDVVGPAHTLEVALDLVQTQALDGAFLDVNLAGRMSWPVAEALAARNIPLVLITGYDESWIDPRYRDQLRLHKPYYEKDVEATLTQILIHL